MIIGVPKEIKNNENRVALTPAGVMTLHKAGHRVMIENNAGVGSGINNGEYVAAGGEILATPAQVYASAEMIMKVKEPLPAEYPFFQDGQLLFTYLHLAPEPVLTAALLKKNVVGIAYETVQPADGSLPYNAT
ncbi:Alanine dehydrogenase/pyridine nucleotide transhydrogenase, N-terminal [Acididesulfobacillus acetoxydans]|uniref:Alanine dehydrogenase n=1 Tax=Acididesulfobacillus acetoxydans TaxID=1561005 RepID=A0A8S0Y3F3_9FIRM|nr:Alanine dehydrogenase/pyridine nucleotide transhydrogenase, N-terminal [Acididesulfobacillus acetoxydans]CEJ08171.1 Alanine dehydrogenase [Acididesulfobacillus acetoxydans]